MAKIGLGAGKPWDPASLDKNVRDAISAGMQAALAEMEEAAKSKVDASSFFRSREGLNKNYFGRAMGVYMGIFGNVETVSVYFSVGNDEEGELFDGSKHDYGLTFALDQIPPAKHFWSMTMYNLPQRLLVDNPIDRYSIGSATPGLKTAADGSISIYVQAKSPGQEKESNWLPAPAGPFWMVLRTYGPGPSILNKTWKLPPVKRVQ